MSKHKIPISNNLLPSLSTLYSASFLTVYPYHEIGLRKAVNQPVPIRYFDKKQKRYNWCNSRDDDISEGNRVETPVLY